MRWWWWRRWSGRSIGLKHTSHLEIRCACVFRGRKYLGIYDVELCGYWVCIVNEVRTDTIGTLVVRYAVDSGVYVKVQLQLTHRDS